MSAVYFYPVLEVSVIIGPSLLAGYSDMFLSKLSVIRRDIKESVFPLPWLETFRKSFHTE